VSSVCASQVDTCLFDKTGTLTTEHLTLRGIVAPTPLPPSQSKAEGAEKGAKVGGPAVLRPAAAAPLAAQMVRIHRCIHIGDRTIGTCLPATMDESNYLHSMRTPQRQGQLVH
jgi:magnesium-transporting ATPase (P-type)